MSARLEWLAQRQQGIGGSDVAAILGLSPWSTPLDVYLSKTEPAEDRDLGEPAYWGNVLESVVADEYSRREKRPVIEVATTLHAPSMPWVLANIDRAVGHFARVEGGRLVGADGILECKTASAFKAADWGRDGDDNEVPVHYAAQCMHYLAVTGLDWCDVACLIGGQRFVSKRINRDEDTISAIIEKVSIFWHDHVLARVPPAPRTSADVLRLHPQDDGEAVEAGEEALLAYSHACVLRQQIEQLEAELEQHTETLKRTIGARSALTVDGKQIVTWKAAKASQKTDWKSVAESYKPDPEWRARFAAATTNVPGSRRLIFCKR